MSELKEVVEEAVKPNIPKIILWVMWSIVILVSIGSLALSYTALQRSKLDNDSIKTISQIADRLEKTANKLDLLSQQNRTFNRDQSDYLHEEDRQSGGAYNEINKKYGNPTVGPDDFSNKWLFTQDNDQRSQQPTGDQKPTNTH